MSISDSGRAKSLIEVLRNRALLQPERCAFTYLSDADGAEIRLTFGELDRAARAMAARLQQSASPGDRVLLLYPHGLEFIKAFFGCLYSGVIAVPAPAPNATRRDRALPRLRSIAEDAQPVAVLSPSELDGAVDQLVAVCPSLDCCERIDTQAVTNDPDAWREPPVDADSLAYLQYTSGSTSAPKGVMVTHHNVLHNEALIQQKCGNTESTTGIGWVPFFHDMGLIGIVLQPIHAGFNCVLLSPASVLQKPLRWLQAISRYRVHGAAAPNFAYELCVERIRERDVAGLDLSCWRVALNGAEPIRPETLERFTRKFAPAGFRCETFLPCYGLAEATLMVTSVAKRDTPTSISVDRESLKQHRVIICGDESAEAVRLVGNGPNAADPHVAIVDPDSDRLCQPDEVGEIWIAGTSVAAGYWRRERESAETFRAKISDCASPNYLRTGDLGFLHDNQLYVTGRLKDVVIVRGSNHYPQDIETTVQATHPALASSRCAAFAVDADGTEWLVVVAEIDRSYRKAPAEELAGIIAAVRREVASRHGVDSHAIRLVLPGGVPVTSSGKTQRQTCREQFEKGALKALAEWTHARHDRLDRADRARPGRSNGRPIDRIHAELLHIVSDVLGVPGDALDGHRPINDFGLDSMAAFELLDRVESALGVRVPISTLLEAPSLFQLAAAVARELNETDGAPDVLSDTDRRQHAAGRFEKTAPAIQRTASRDLIEDELCRLWSQVLDAPAIGLDGDFFALGGNSLSMTQLISRVRETFDVELPIRELFDTPTVAGTAELIRQRMTSGGAASLRGPIEPVERDGELQLSFAQQRLWFVDQLSPHNALYNVPTAVRLTGPLQLDVLKRALTEIVARHEALRTRFATIDGQPRQVISGEPEFDFRVENLSGREQSDDALAAIFRDAGRQPFDLRRGPLMRVTLVRLGALEHALLLSMHHIVCDIWSMGVILRELAELYECLRNGRPALLPALPVQMADYAAWQRTWYDDAAQDADLQYWKERLAAAPVLQLPTDRPRPAIPSYRGATHWFEFPASVRKSLDDLSRDEGVTPFMTLLALFQVLLSRYSGQDDVVVGTPIAGRTRREIEELIGCFINSLPLRTDLSGDPSFREVLRRVREACLGAYAHQELPFEKLVEELQLERDLSREPLFQVMLVLQNAPLPKREVGDVELSILEADAGTSKFDLTLFVWDWTDTFTGQVEYSTDLFSETTIVRMLEHLRTLLESVATDPEQRISEVPILPESERRLLHSEFSTTPGEGPPEACIHEWIESQAARSPEVIAVALGDEQLSYGELDARASRLAPTLRALGAGPDVLVGLCVEPSVEMIVGILGILKASAAYVPIDPAIPADRKQFILEETRAPILLTERRLADVLPDTAARVLCLDDDCSSTEGDSRQTPPTPSVPENLAYVIYTSGSSGPPKGVAVSHRNLVHSTSARMLYYRDPVDCYLLLSSFSFDSSVAGLFWTLCQGGTLMMMSREVARDPVRIAELIERHDVSHLLALPALYELILDRMQSFASSMLRTAIVAGEACPPALVERHAETLPHTRLFNEYGPTEATVWCSVYECGPRSVDNPVPIGRPIPGARIYVLDPHCNLAPIGIPGELCVGGAGVTRGYLDRPGATAERYIPDPFADEPGARLYRTGDRCRWRADGNLEFLGRIDRQVKIRGYRIEPGEIESALADHADVRDAVVVPQDAAGDKRLVAYYTALGQRVPSSIELRHFLRDRLPVYMTPALFVHLDELPRTATGKLDREALPAPNLQRQEFDESYVAPRNETERRLASIWADLLGIKRVGIHDNLFELGGHSLLAVRVVSRIQQTFRVDVPLRELFETPTVAGVAEVIEHSEQVSVAPIERVSRDGELPLSFAQQRLWFLEQLSPGQTSLNVPLAVRVSGPLDVDVLRRCLNEVVRRHEILRTTFGSSSGRPIQIVQPELEIDAPLIDLGGLPVESREAAAHDHARQMVARPFSLESGPLLRGAILGLADEDHVLLLVMHHIVSDGWSLGIFIDEMATLYGADREGHPAPLPDLTIQYADFAAWQQDQLQGSVLDEHLAYWRRQLLGTPMLELPTDHLRPAQPAHVASTHAFEVSPQVSSGLKSLSDSEGATLYMTLLAAFNVLLQRYTAQNDIAVGCPVANRTRPEIEKLIGFFVNVLVMRNDLSGNPTFTQFLAQVRETAQNGFAHQDLPCEKIVAELQPDRELDKSFVQVAFALQNLAMQPVNVAGLELRDFETPSAAVKCDLSLTMWETDGELRGVFEFDGELFEEQSIAELSNHFLTLLESVVAQPGRPILELPCLSKAEDRKLAAKRQRVAASSESDGSVERPTADEELEQLLERTNLTKNQLLVWTGQKLFAGSPIYSSAAILSIRGAIDRERFERAVVSLVTACDALRTVVEETDGLPYQRVLPDIDFSLEFHDISGEPDPHASLEHLTRERSRICFALETRLFDTALFKLADDRFAWYLNQHHIISDGRSFELICRFVEREYRRLRQENGRAGNGSAQTLPAFSSFVRFEQEQRRTPAYEAAKRYWETKLKEQCEPIRFYGRSGASRSTNVVRRSYDLGTARTQQIVALAADSRLEALSPQLARFVIFASALFAYLHRISGQRPLSLGTPVLNRANRRFRETVGLFMHVLPLRVRLSGDETFRSLMQKVADDALESVRHQQYVVRNPPTRPAYNVVLNYLPVAALEFDGVPVRAQEISSGEAIDPLTVVVRDHEDRDALSLDFQFQADVFSPEQQQRTIDHLVRMLDALLEDPNAPLHRPNVLSDAETVQLVDHFSHCEAEKPVAGPSIVEMFEAQVGRTPDAPAVLFESGNLSYAELDARSNRLAHYLRTREIGPDLRVGLCLKRSSELIVGLLGVLKAGGAYVPLDPALPPERLAIMLNQAGVQVVLTQQRLLEQLPAESLQTVCLDSDWGQIATYEPESPEVAADRENLAYVIFTSGSTGSPTAVGVSRGALASYVQVACEQFEISSNDRVLQFASIGFDTAAEEIFPALTSGALLALRDDDMLGSPARFLAECGRLRITVLDLPTAYWHEIALALADPDVHLPRTLRLVIIGGEQARSDCLESWRQAAPAGVRLINTYGPTEATIVSTCCELSDADEAGNGTEDRLSRVPIGRAIPTARVYVLDAHLNPLSIGMIGELYIAGHGLARGYLGSPQLTAERFLPNPFAAEPGLRLYRTGDRCRFRPDGTLEFIGRCDEQVKIRGYRIEPAEVEAAIIGHPQVREAIVVPRDLGNAGIQLVAYFVPDSDAGPSDLRTFLQSKLPDYMLPGTFVEMKRLPVTVNGKIDRAALPQPSSDRPDLDQQFVLARSDVEEKLSALWCDVLGVKRVGVHDSFFALGGHSLLATQIIARARETFGADLSLRRLFEAPTIAAMAELVEQAGQAVQLPPIDIVSRRKPLPLSYAQERVWFMEQYVSGGVSYNMPATVRVSGSLDMRALRRAVNEIVRRHEVLRTTFTAVDGQPIQVVSREVLLDVTVEDLGNLSAEEQESKVRWLIEDEVNRPFDLTVGPLIRTRAIRLADDVHVLMLTMHHIISDGHSIGIFIRELAALYSEFVTGAPAGLSELPIQYADYAAWQRDWLSGDVLQEQLSYWKTQLTDVPMLDLPLDRARPAEQRFQEAIHQLRLPPELSHSLRELSDREGVTLFMTLLAGFQVVLSRYSGQDDFAIGSPIASRRQTELELLIGLFLNTLVLRADVSADPSFCELVARVREVCLGAYAHQDIPFERLVQELAPQRTLQQTPLFRVLFNFNAYRRDLSGAELFGLEVEGLSVEGESKFDLTLYVGDEGEEIDLGFAYNAQLFDASTIAELARSYQHILEAAVTAPTQRVSALATTAVQDRKALIAGFTGNLEGM